MCVCVCVCVCVRARARARVMFLMQAWSTTQDPEMMQCCETGESYLAGIHTHDGEEEIQTAIAAEGPARANFRALLLRAIEKLEASALSQ